MTITMSCWPGSLLPTSSVQLGRFIRNVQSPHQEFIDPFSDRPNAEESSAILHRNFSDHRRFSKTTRLGSYLRRTFSIWYERQNSRLATLTASVVTTHELQNATSWFNAACACPAIQRFLEESMHTGGKVYLIVGFRTAKDAEIIKKTTLRRRATASGQFPITSGIWGSRVDGTISIRSGQDFSYTAPGEQVFAISILKVKLRPLSRAKTQNMSLEPTPRWRSCWDHQYRHHESEELENEETENEEREPKFTDNALDVYDGGYYSDSEIDRAGLRESHARRASYMYADPPGLGETGTGLQTTIGTVGEKHG